MRGESPSHGEVESNRVLTLFPFFFASLRSPAFVSPFLLFLFSTPDPSPHLEAGLGDCGGRGGTNHSRQGTKANHHRKERRGKG